VVPERNLPLRENVLRLRGGSQISRGYTALHEVKPQNQIRAGGLKGRLVIEKLAAHPEFQSSPGT